MLSVMIRPMMCMLLLRCPWCDMIAHWKRQNLLLLLLLLYLQRRHIIRDYDLLTVCAC